MSVGGEDAFGEALDHGAGEGEILRARIRSCPGLRRRGGGGTSTLTPSRSFSLHGVPSSPVADTWETLLLRGGMLARGEVDDEIDALATESYGTLSAALLNSQLPGLNHLPLGSRRAI